MKKSISYRLVLSLSAIFSLVSCGEGSVSSSLPTSSIGENVSISIKKNFYPDIQFGPKNAVNMDDYVLLTGASDYQITSSSPTIRIYGHTIQGIDYGPFELTISSGNASASVSGHIVTGNKMDFNASLTNFEDHYVAYSPFTGLMLIGENYHLIATESNDIYTLYEGSITDPSTGLAYPIETISLPLYELGKTPEFSDTLYFGSGYARSNEYLGFKGFYESELSFTEQLDENGDPTGYYLLEDTPASVEGEPSRVEALMNSLIGSSSGLYEVYKQYCKITSLAANFKGGVLNLYPADKTGKVITTLYADGTPISTAISLWAAETGPYPAAEAWVSNPVLPEGQQLPRGEIASFLAELEKATSFSVHTYGKWYNPETGNITVTPPGMAFEDDNSEILNVFDVETFVAQGASETIFHHVDENATYITGTSPLHQDEDRYLAYANGRNTYGVNGSVYDGVFAYGEPSRLPGIGSDPVASSRPSFPEGLFDKCSFFKKEESEGKVTFSYNVYGPDMKEGLNEYYAGLPYFVADNVPEQLAHVSVFYMNYTGWLEDYSNVTLSIDTLKNEFHFEATLVYSQYVSYSWGMDIVGVGENHLSSEALALLTK